MVSLASEHYFILEKADEILKYLEYRSSELVLEPVDEAILEDIKSKVTVILQIAKVKSGE